MASSTVNGGGSHRGAPSCAYQTPKWILNYLNRCRRQLPKGSPEWQEYTRGIRILSQPVPATPGLQIVWRNPCPPA